MARGVALIAMIAVHIAPVGPTGSLAALQEITRGRSSAAFAVLAGVALALAYGGSTPLRGRAWAGAAAGLAVRCVLIGVIGLFVGELDSGVAVILVYYALLFVLAAPLLSLSAPALAWLAGCLCVFAPVLSHLLRMDLAPMRGSSPVWADLTGQPWVLLTELSLTGYYPVLVWTTYLAAGLAVGRLDLSSRAVAERVIAVGLGLAVGAAVVSSWLVERGIAEGELPPETPALVVRGTVPTDPWWLAVASPHAGTPLDLAHTTGTALMLLGLLLLLPARFGAALRPLAWVGGMTLTLYAVHVVALAYDVGPDEPGQRYLAHVVAVVVLAAAWRSWAARGPLEQLVSWPSRGTAVLVRGGA